MWTARGLYKRILIPAGAFPYVPAQQAIKVCQIQYPHYRLILFCNSSYRINNNPYRYLLLLHSPAALYAAVSLYLKSNLLLVLRSLLAFVCCIQLFTAFGQVNQQYIFHHLGQREGLLSEETNATAQDEKGYIWIAGKNGLQRYDGHRLLDFTHLEGDSSSLPDNNIMQLAIDKKNRLWLLSSNYSLGYFDVNQFSFHTVAVINKNRPQRNASMELKLDREKNILLLYGSADNVKGVLGYDEKKQAFAIADSRFAVPEGWDILNFSFDSLQGNCWIGTSRGLVKYEPASGTFSYRGHNSSKDPAIDALQGFTMVAFTCSDKLNNTWLVSTDGEGKKAHLIKYIPASNKLADYYDIINARLSNVYHTINALVQAGMPGTVWVTGRNLFISAADQPSFILTDIPGEFSIHYDDINNLMPDREGNMWISTNRGLYHTNPSSSVFNYTVNRKPGSNTAYTSDVVDFLHLPNKNILVAGWGDGLFEYDSNFNPVRSEIAEQAAKLGEKQPWALHRCSNGDIWSPNQNGVIFVYHAARHSTEKIHDPVFENKTIRQIAEDRNGNLWFGTQGQLLIKWIKASNRFELVRKTNAPVFRLYADKKGDIWVVADEVLKLDIETGAIVCKYNTGPADGKHLLSGEITDIIQFNDTSYIIASRGLNILFPKSGQIRYHTSTNGLPSDYISNIIADKAGNLWIATENGVCCHNFKKNELHIYSIEDGIYNSAFTPTSSAMLNDGRIVIGTNHNIMVFDPGAARNDGPIPASRIEITGISVMNRPLRLDSLLQLDNIELGYSENSLAINFSSLTYTLRYDIAWMMEGLEKTPVPALGRTEAVYSYLPPGSYTFKVGVPDPNGIITQFSSIQMTVRAPFWKRPEFYMALALAAAALVWWIDRERIKRIKDIQQMRNSIGQELHTEVSTTLNTITLLSEIAAMKTGVNPELSKDYIQQIKLKSRSTVAAMDDVMWSIDPSNDSMQKTAERMQEIADMVKHEYDTATTVSIDKNVLPCTLSMKERLEFILIYKKTILLMGNDLQAKKITASLTMAGKDLVMILNAQGPALLRTDKTTRGLEEIKARTAAIRFLSDIRESDTAITVTMVIKKQQPV